MPKITMLIALLGAFLLTATASRAEDQWNLYGWGRLHFGNVFYFGWLRLGRNGYAD